MSYCKVKRETNRDLVVAGFFKNHEHFSEKLYKGLVFKEKKGVSKYKMGEKGVARGYVKIAEE